MQCPRQSALAPQGSDERQQAAKERTAKQVAAYERQLTELRQQLGSATREAAEQRAASAAAQQVGASVPLPACPQASCVEVQNEALQVHSH